MNKLEYYSRQKTEWDENELQQMKAEYETKQMNISEIADIHRRTPGSISYKLKLLDLIPHYMLSRGYSDYKNSALYKEIVETSTATAAEKKAKKEAALTAKVDTKPNDTVDTPQEEVSVQKTRGLRIRNEIADLKKDVKEILRLINAIYDFEAQ